MKIKDNVLSVLSEIIDFISKMLFADYVEGR